MTAKTKIIIDFTRIPKAYTEKGHAELYVNDPDDNDEIADKINRGIFSRFIVNQRNPSDYDWHWNIRERDTDGEVA